MIIFINTKIQSLDPLHICKDVRMYIVHTAQLQGNYQIPISLLSYDYKQLTKQMLSALWDKPDYNVNCSCMQDDCM